MLFSKDIAHSLILASESDNFVVDFEQAYQWLEYSKKGHAKTNFLNCGFVENVDYQFREIETASKGTPRQEIKLTIDSFKQWAMMSGTIKGREVRIYFLECEKELKSKNNIVPYLPGEEAAYFAAKYLESHQENKQLKAQIEIDAPKVSAWEMALKAGGTFSVNTVAKLFNICKPGETKPLGEIKLFQLLRDERYFFKANKCNLAYQQFLNLGYFETIVKTVGNSHNPINVSITRFTVKGIEKVFAHLTSLGYEIMENNTIDKQTVNQLLAE